MEISQRTFTISAWASVTISLGLTLAAFQGCGPVQEEPAAPAPAADDGYAAVAGIVAKDCGTCHKPGSGLPTFETGAKFKASKAKAEIQGGDMPPGGRHLDAGDKTAMLNYLGG